MFSGVRLATDAESTPAGWPSALANDVTSGLASPVRTLPSKYFYDNVGSRLFERICETPEYYLTRAEVALLSEAAPEIAACIPEQAVLVEFGSGASTKTRLLLDAAWQLAAYVPIDISPDALAHAAAAIRDDYPNLLVRPLARDFTAPLSLPPELPGGPRIGFFPGSTLGNFAPDDATTFMDRVRRLLGEGSQFLVGVDLVKDEPTMVSAYDDAGGVTAAFNRNLLTRNRELRGTFAPDAFKHRAVWNANESRMEMWLESVQDQTVQVLRRTYRFAEGERIHTESSYKFTYESFVHLAERAGWEVDRCWVRPDPQFAMFLLRS